MRRKLAHPEPRVVRVQLVQWVQQVVRVHRVHLRVQLRVQQALQAVLESRVLLEASARQATQAWQVRQASLGLRWVQ